MKNDCRGYHRGYGSALDYIFYDWRGLERLWQKEEENKKSLTEKVKLDRINGMVAAMKYLKKYPFGV